MFGSASKALRMTTLGSTAHVAKNAALSLTFMPKQYGVESQPVSALFIAGAIMLSHPFEVARVLIVDGEKTHLTGNTLRTLKALYSNEGLAGLYRGFVPRAIHLFPVLMSANYLIDPKENWKLNTVPEFSERQGQ